MNVASTSPSPVTGPPPLLLDIRPMKLDDLGYARWSFAEGHKGAPGTDGMSWRYYKRFIVPELDKCLSRPETMVLAAYVGAVPAGWIAFHRGRRVSTVHWAHTRFQLGESGQALRRRGVMTTLFEAAGIGERICYTFKGAAPMHGRKGRSQATMDEKLLPWLRKRGGEPVYIPWEEWSV